MHHIQIISAVGVFIGVFFFISYLNVIMAKKSYSLLNEWAPGLHLGYVAVWGPFVFGRILSFIYAQEQHGRGAIINQDAWAGPSPVVWTLVSLAIVVALAVFLSIVHGFRAGNLKDKVDRVAKAEEGVDAANDANILDSLRPLVPRDSKITVEEIESAENHAAICVEYLCSRAARRPSQQEREFLNRYAFQKCVTPSYRKLRTPYDLAELVRSDLREVVEDMERERARYDELGEVMGRLTTVQTQNSPEFVRITDENRELKLDLRDAKAEIRLLTAGKRRQRNNKKGGRKQWR